MIYVTRWKRVFVSHTPACLEEQTGHWVESCGCPVCPVPPDPPPGAPPVRLVAVVPCTENYVIGYWEDRD